jgi:hypothetical protein
MAKLVLDDVTTTGDDLITLMNLVNANNALIETALENTLSRDGTTPNFMDANFDMNGYDILNVGNLWFVPGGGDNLAYYNVCNQYIKGQATSMHAATISGGVYTPVCCDSNVHKITLDQDVTIGAPTGALDGQVINFIFKQDATGGWTVTFNSVFKFPNGTPTTVTATANAVDVLSCQYDSEDEVWLCTAGQDYS